MSITIDKDGVCNQDELTFQVNDFRQPKVLTNYYQVAKRLQNLVLMKKGTMPNDYDMGLDINSYRFEYRNDKTQNLIKSDLQVQIDKYLPDIPVSNFEILFKTIKILFEKESTEGFSDEVSAAMEQQTAEEEQRRIKEQIQAEEEDEWSR